MTLDLAEVVQPHSDVPADLHCGRDGWLFLIGGTNRVKDIFGEESAVDSEKIDSWSSLLLERQRRARQLGADYLHVVVPEKLTVYSEFSGLDGINIKNSAVHRLSEYVARRDFDALVDCLTPMLRQKRFRNLYYKTDTHWNFHGCLCAYLEVCRMSGAIPAGHVLSPTFNKTMLTLDLGSKLTNPIEEEFRVYNFTRYSSRTHSNAIVNYKEACGRENDGGWHVGSHVIFSNGAEVADPRRVVIFGDSFSEYRRHLLTGLLAETFHEVHFIWSTSIDWSYVELQKPSLVLTEIAERFLTSVPTDTFSLENYAKSKMEGLPLTT